MDGHDGVFSIVRAAEHFFDFGRFDGGLELVQTTHEVAGHILALTCPLDEDAKILGAALQRLTRGGVFLDPAPALQDLLGLGLVLPEIGLGDPLLDIGDLLRRVGGVKDTSGDPSPACSDPRTGGRVHQEQLPYASRCACPGRAQCCFHTHRRRPTTISAEAVNAIATYATTSPTAV
jgi:hypothetical protein